MEILKPSFLLGYHRPYYGNRVGYRGGRRGGGRGRGTVRSGGDIGVVLRGIHGGRRFATRGVGFKRYFNNRQQRPYVRRFYNNLDQPPKIIIGNDDDSVSCKTDNTTHLSSASGPHDNTTQLCGAAGTNPMNQRRYVLPPKYDPDQHDGYDHSDGETLAIFCFDFFRNANFQVNSVLSVFVIFVIEMII